MKLAMIVLDLTSEILYIVHDSNKKLKLVSSDAAAEKYVQAHLTNARLLGTFPDPSSFIKIVLKERDNAKKTKAVRSKS